MEQGNLKQFPRIKISIDIKILLIFSFFTLVLRWLTLMEVNTGGDNIDYWYFAKALLKGYPYDPIFHRSIRWGIILPTAFIQALFGIHAWVIYLPSLFLTLLLNWNCYWIGKRLFNRETAFISIVLIQFFPYMIRLSSQLFLALFSVNYLLLSFLFLLKYLQPLDGKEQKRSRLYFLLSLLFMFLAYQTKITNLYLLIPWLIIVLGKKGLKEALLFGLILLGLYLLEHTAYFLILHEPLGRLGIIMNTHFGSGAMAIGEGGLFDGTFIGLFERYSLSNFPLYWHVVLWGGILSGIILRKKKEFRESATLLLLITGIFLVILTFGVKGIHPVVPFEDFIARYFSPLLPFMCFFISALFWEWFCNIRKAVAWLNKDVVLFPLAFFIPLSMIWIIALLLPYLPDGAREYLNQPLHLNDHIFLKTVSWERESNRALEEGIPIASWREKKDFPDKKRLSRKNLDTVNRWLLQLPAGEGAYPLESLDLAGSGSLYYLQTWSDIADKMDSPWLCAYRLPFELKGENIGELD